MKRILHMTPPEISNGVYRYIFNHMPFIDQNEYQFCFLTKNAEGLMETPEYATYGFPVYRLDNVQRDGREAFEKEVRGILGEGFDAVHLHTSLWRGFLIEEVAMDMGIGRVIVHSHSTGVDFADGRERDRIYREHVRYKAMFTMEYATDACACSELAADWLFSESVPRERVRIMPNAIDVKKYSYNAGVRRRVREELGVGDRTVLGSVGRYSHAKNQEFLVDCFCGAHKRDGRLFLILMGQGENLHKIKGRVKALGMEGSVLCCGWKDNVQDYLQAMDAFCLPSRFEGLPISVVEAQAAGLRCLVSDRVTRELDLTGNVRFLPLRAEAWENAFLEQGRDYRRDDAADALGRAGYAIEASCGRLRALYDGVL